MSISAIPFGHAIDRPAKSRKGFFARMIESRAAAAEARVNAYLAHLSDEKLAGLGYDARSIAKLRAENHSPQAFWI